MPAAFKERFGVTLEYIGGRGKRFPVLYDLVGFTGSGLVFVALVVLGAAVVFPEYDHSPEAHYPVAIEQNYTAARWVVSEGESKGLDAGRIAVAGDSVGGNMSIALTLMAKERGGPKLAAQVLFYPVTDASFVAGSHHVAVAWTNPTDLDLAKVVIRRAAGPTAPASITAGQSVCDPCTSPDDDAGLDAGDLGTQARIGEPQIEAVGEIAKGFRGRRRGVRIECAPAF